MKRTGQESILGKFTSEALVFSSTVLVILLYIQTASAQLDPNQITALRDLYQGTDGPTSWIRKWDLNTSNHCNWYGIICNAGKTSVEQM